MTVPPLTRSEDGIWRSQSSDRVHYPDKGSESCFAVEDRSFWFAYRNRVILDATQRLQPGATRFLDIGAGNGFVSRALAGHGHQVTALEPSEDGARNTQGRGIADVICATFRPELFDPQSFDMAGMFDVIEHIEDDTSFASNAAKVIRPGGHLLITVPALPMLFSPDDTAAGHFRRYTRQSAARMLSAAGLQPIRTSYFMAGLLPPVLLMRTIPGWMGIRRGLDRARDRKEHGDGSALGALAGRILSLEAGVLARGGTMPFGTSVLAVGRVPSSG